MPFLKPLPNFDFYPDPVALTLTVRQHESRYQLQIKGYGQITPFRPMSVSRDDLQQLNRDIQEQLALCLLDNEPMSNRSFESLAEIGHDAYQSVFQSEDSRSLIEGIESNGQSLPIEIICDDDFALPWELIYPPRIGSPVSVDAFWGMRHVISRVIQTANPQSPIILYDGLPRLGLITDLTLLHVAEREVPFFEGIQDADKIKLIHLRPLSPANRLGELVSLRDWLKRDQGHDKSDDVFHLVHLACHAEYHRESPRNSVLIVSDDFSVSLREIDVHELRFRGNPLVVLNACDTGNLNPLYTSSFVNTFLKAGALGVVATECPVPDEFAAEFSEALYTRLLDGQQLGPSLLATRQHFWETHGNPTGLIYSMYASQSVRLKKASTRGL